MDCGLPGHLHHGATFTTARFRSSPAGQRHPRGGSQVTRYSTLILVPERRANRPPSRVGIVVAGTRRWRATVEFLAGLVPRSVRLQKLRTAMLASASSARHLDEAGFAGRCLSLEQGRCTIFFLGQERCTIDARDLHIYVKLMLVLRRKSTGGKSWRLAGGDTLMYSTHRSGPHQNA